MQGRGLTRRENEISREREFVTTLDKLNFQYNKLDVIKAYSKMEHLGHVASLKIKMNVKKQRAWSRT